MLAFCCLVYNYRCSSISVSQRVYWEINYFDVFQKAVKAAKSHGIIRRKGFVAALL